MNTRILYPLILLVAFFLSLTLFSTNTEKAYSSTLQINHKTETVYICTGKSSKKYHSKKDCRGLKRCSGDIIEVSVEDAENMGKTPCKICYK
jgi:hypothetical protein